MTPYREAALAEARLVWTVPEAPALVVAKVFDGADPETGPFFDPAHPRIDGPDRDRLVAYLSSAPTVLGSDEHLDDVVDPGNVGTVPVSFRCDGRWIWPDAVAHYLERYGIAPDPGLRAHALGAGAPPTRLSRLSRHRAIETLTAPEPEEGEACQPA